MSGLTQHTRFDKLLLAPEEYTSVAGGPKHGCKIFVDIFNFISKKIFSQIYSVEHAVRVVVEKN